MIKIYGVIIVVVNCHQNNCCYCSHLIFLQIFPNLKIIAKHQDQRRQILTKPNWNKTDTWYLTCVQLSPNLFNHVSSILPILNATITRNCFKYEDDIRARGPSGLPQLISWILVCQFGQIQFLLPRHFVVTGRDWREISFISSDNFFGNKCGHFWLRKVKNHQHHF